MIKIVFHVSRHIWFILASTPAAETTTKATIDKIHVKNRSRFMISHDDEYNIKTCSVTPPFSQDTLRGSMNLPLQDADFSKVLRYGKQSKIIFRNYIRPLKNRIYSHTFLLFINMLQKHDRDIYQYWQRKSSYVKIWNPLWDPCWKGFTQRCRNMDISNRFRRQLERVATNSLPLQCCCGW